MTNSYKWDLKNKNTFLFYKHQITILNDSQYMLNIYQYYRAVDAKPIKVFSSKNRFSINVDSTLHFKQDMLKKELYTLELQTKPTKYKSKRNVNLTFDFNINDKCLYLVAKDSVLIIKDKHFSANILNTEEYILFVNGVLPKKLKTSTTEKLNVSLIHSNYQNFSTGIKNPIDENSKGYIQKGVLYIITDLSLYIFHKTDSDSLIFEETKRVSQSCN